MKEDENLDTVLDTKEYNNIKKKVKSGLRKNIYSRIILVILCSILIIGGGYFGISKIYDMQYYNPTKNNIDFKNNDNKSFDLLMSIYFNIYNPDYIYYGYNFNDTNYEALGFARYSIKGSFFYNFGMINYGSNMQEIQVDKNKITISSKVSKTVNIFYDSDDEKPEYNKDSIISKIEKMPDSSIINAAFSFKEKKDIESFIIYMQQYQDSNFVYFATKVMGSDYLGFGPYLGTSYEFKDAFNKKYPNLVSVEDTVSSYTNHYVSMLKLLLDQKDFLNVAKNSFYDNNCIENIEEEINAIENDGLEILGFKVHGSKQEILEMLKSDVFSYAYVSDAKFSEFSNSY